MACSTKSIPITDKIHHSGSQSFLRELVPGTEPQPQWWEARVLPLCHRGPLRELVNPDFNIWDVQVKFGNISKSIVFLPNYFKVTGCELNQDSFHVAQLRISKWSFLPQGVQQVKAYLLQTLGAGPHFPYQ